MSNEHILAGLDSGFGYGILVTEDKSFIIENYIDEISKSIAESLASEIGKIDTNNVVMKYDGKYYVVGKLCKENQLDTVHRYSKDRRNIYHLIEILSLLGFASNSSEFDVSVCFGLPNFLRNERKEFEKWITGKYDFSYLCSMGEIKKHIVVKNADFIPQPFAPIFTLPEDKHGKFICSLDLGHGSLDQVLVRNLKIVKQAGTLFYGEGVIRCYKQLRDLVIDRYSKSEYRITEISESKLQEIIETGIYRVGDDELEVKDILEFVLQQYADYIYQQCESNIGNYLTSVDIFIASGGILNNSHFKDMLKDKFKSTYNKPFMTSKKPQYCIAEGYYYFAKLKYHDIIEEVAADEN